MKKVGLLLFLSAFFSLSTVQAQCTQKIQIESILVDACNTNVLEPNNEMVRFKNGPNSLNISQISIAGANNVTTYTNNVWPTPSLTWNGLIQNATTSAVTASLQATVVSPCGHLIEPPSGVIPPNADVLMICSTNPDPTDNSFANLVDTLYIVYHNASYTVTTGHFLNYQSTSAFRCLVIKDNAHGCSDTASYDPSLLAGHGNGDAVAFDNAGNATYYNDGCQAAFVPITVSTNTLASACNNSTINPSGVVGGPAVTYSWTTSGTGTLSISTGTLSGNGNTAVTANYNPGAGESGTVTFTLTGQGECSSASASSTVSVYINNAPSPSISSSNGTTICSGNSTVLTASATGTLSTSYSWNPGSATTSTLSVSPPVGTQVYTVTGTNSCGSNDATFTVTANPLPTITVANDSVCTGGGPGTLSVSGTASTYTWSTGVQTNTLSASAGTYTVTGTDGNGCKNTATAQVVSIALPTITTNTSSICEGVASVLTASGAAANSYTWSPGGPSGNDTYSVTPSGTTAIVVTGSDSHGCQNTHTVTINPTPTLTLNNASMCSGQSVTLQASPGSLTSYTWTGVTSSVSTATVSPASNTSYTVQGTDANGCISNEVIATVSVTATTQIMVASTSTAPCVGSTYTLTGTGANTYNWIPSIGTFTSLDGNNTQISVNQSSSPVTFTVTGTGACPATGTVVTITPSPVSTLSITSSPSQSVCPGGSITLTASNASTYTWSPSAITNGVAFTPTASATYTVDGTDANGCAAASQTVSITVFTPATLSMSDEQTCFGQSVTLSASPSTLTSYTWTGASSSTYSASVSPASTTSYTVQATDLNGCVTNAVAATVSITAAVPVTVASSNNMPCIGSTYTLSANGATTYTWVPSSGTFTSLDGNNTQISVTQGTASVTFTVSGTGSCAATPTVITISPAPVTTLTAISAIPSQTVCAGDMVTLSTSGGTSGTYVWSTGNSNTATLTLSPSVSTTVNVSAMDANGCTTAPVSVQVIVNQVPTLTVTASPFCVGGQTILMATSSSALSTYTWSTGDVTTTNTLAVTPTGAITYSVSGTDANSCTENGNTSVSPDVVAVTFIANPLTGEAPLVVTFTNTTTGGVVYNWDFGDGNSITTNSLVVSETYSVMGTYEAYLNVMDAFGCQGMDSVTIVVSEHEVIIIPNIFSPNGDGINDLYSITATGVSNFNCKIYDRWGILLYEWNGTNGGWDGKDKSSGMMCTDGTYYYLIDYRDNTSSEVKKSGFFQLVR